MLTSQRTLDGDVRCSRPMTSSPGATSPVRALEAECSRSLVNVLESNRVSGDRYGARNTLHAVYNPRYHHVSSLYPQIPGVKVLSGVRSGRQVRVAPSLVELQITGLGVRTRHSWRHCPKEDSESRARSYLVEVDQHLSSCHRRREAPRTPITSSNQITSACSPLVGQRDPHGAVRQVAGRSPGTFAWRRGREASQSQINLSSAGTNRKLQEKLLAASLCEVLCVQRVARPSHSAPPQAQPLSETNIPICVETPVEDTFPKDPGLGAFPQPADPRTLFTVTIRTTASHKKPLGQNRGEESSVRPPATGQQQQQNPGSCAHVSAVRGASTLPPSATCLTTSPRRLQSPAGRCCSNTAQSAHTHRWYIAPHSPRADQLHTQSRTGYTCAPTTALPELRLVKVGSGTVLAFSEKLRDGQ